MAVKTTQENKGTVYFCTFTCCEWLPLFELTQAYDAIYKWLDYMQDKYENRIVGYVIMPNHLHVLVYVSTQSPTINKLLSNGKRFLAYEIVQRLKQQEADKGLAILRRSVLPFEQKNGKQHAVFQRSSDIKECMTEQFLLQKLSYIHANPLAGKWKLAPTPADYMHSSARWYQKGEHGIYPVSDYRDEF